MGAPNIVAEGRHSVQTELREQYWPGNVRQLKHLVDRVRIYGQVHGSRAARMRLLQGDFYEDMNGIRRPSLGTQPPNSQMSEQPPVAPVLPVRPKDISLEEFRRALRAAGGHIPEAGRLLGLPRSTAYRLHDKFKRFRSFGESKLD